MSGFFTANQSTGPTHHPTPPTIQFQEIPIGQHFEFRGRRYKKLALSMASDEERNGTIFQGQTEVMPDPLSRTAQPPEQVDSPEPPP